MIVMQQNTPTPLAQVVGTWQNTAAPYKHRMQIAYRQPFYAVSFDLQTKSCGGSVDGLATYDEAQQMLLLQSPVADGEACHIRIQVLGEQTIVTENSACLYYHGVACNFEGRFEKNAAPLESAKRLCQNDESVNNCQFLYK